MTIDLDRLSEHVQALEQRLQRLETENADLRAQVTAPAAAPAVEPLSRRLVLKKSAGVVGAGVGLALAGSLLGPRGARAAAGDPMLVGKSNTAGGQATLLGSTHGAFTLRVTNTATGAGSDDALEAMSDHGRAIWARSSDTVRPSIQGQKDVAGAAVVGLISLSTGTSNALDGTTHGSGAGVFGNSAKGRGGVFAGLAAQVRLRPSSMSTHPASGMAGDLFVDSAKRLWLCTTGDEGVGEPDPASRRSGRLHLVGAVTTGSIVTSSSRSSAVHSRSLMRAIAAAT